VTLVESKRSAARNASGTIPDVQRRGKMNETKFEAQMELIPGA